MRAYLAGWVVALAIALAVTLARRRALGLWTAAYARHLAAPWKLVTFAVATTAIALAAPYSGDPTWDLGDSLLVSAVTFVTAPWSVGTLARALRSRRDALAAATAFVVFWAPCWAYDAYILARDGAYPPTWLSNLGLSGAIVACAGLFWNLGEVPGRGVWLTFVAEPWPPPGATPFSRVAAPAALLALPVAIAILAFVVLDRC
jgi:hypothetical protein